MTKNKKINIYILLFFLTIVSIINVEAASFGVDNSGTSAAGIGTSAGGVVPPGMYEITGCYGLKISLVKIRNDDEILGTPKMVSTYNIFVQDYAYYAGFTTKNDNGPGVVVGSISEGGYSFTGSTNKTYTTQELGMSKFFTDISKLGLTYESERTKSELTMYDSNENITQPTDTFYKILYYSLISDNVKDYSVFPDFNMDEINDVQALKELFVASLHKDSPNYDMAREKLSVFNGYRVVIEPIYVAGSGRPGSWNGFIYATSKAVANYYQQGKYSVFNIEKLLNNSVSSETHGSINENGIVTNFSDETESIEYMKNVNTGYGYLVITISDEYEAKPKPKEYTCPEGTGVDGGTTPYITDYMFMVELEKGKHDSNLYIRADNELFVDGEVFLKVLKERFGNEENMEYKLTLLDRKKEGDGSGTISILKDATAKGEFEKNKENDGKETILKQDFWNHYKSAVSNSNLYYEGDKGHYYIVHSAYTGFGVGGKGWGKTEVQSNANTTKYNNQTINIYPTGPTMQLLPGVGSNGSHSFTINYETVDEFDTSEAYAPAMYRLRYCINGEGEPPKDCKDTTQGAECTASGTHAIFHEDDKLTTCTLTKDNNSGFTLVDTTDTQNYCTVACKDDFDILLPGTKATKAGEYYVLNNSTPTISSKRTCVTSNINYSKFSQDLSNIETNMPTQYDTWHDHYEVANHLLSGSSTNVKETKADSIYTTKTETCHSAAYASCSEKTDATERSECESANTGTYTYEEYKHNGQTYKYVKQGAEVCGPSTGEGAAGTGGWSAGGQSLEDRTGKTPNEYVEEQAKKLTASSAAGISGNSGAVGEKTTGTSKTSCCKGEGDDKVCEDKEYSWESWTIYSYSPENGKYYYPGRTGYWSNPCGKESGKKYATGLAEEQTAEKNKANTSSGVYSTTVRNYANTISGYNRCFNWNDKTEDYEIRGNSAWNSVLRLNPGTGDYYEDLKFDFKPKVEYKYDDKEMGIFKNNGAYHLFKYGSGDHTEDDRYNSKYTVTTGFKQDMTYWPEGTSSIDEHYTGNGKAKNETTRDIIVCDGTTCTQKRSTKFYNSSYLKRYEDIEYVYHLPDVSTEIPNGKVDLTENWRRGEKVDLEKDASPVAITTPAKKYNYYIRIGEVKDSVRVSKTDDGTNTNDHIEDRFISSSAHVLNASGGDEYSCTYNVINDLYKDKKYNFFYRVIDPLDISHPKGIPLGYNWSDDRGQKVQETMKEAEENYQVLTNSDRDKFVFTLTPLIMKQIRNYNAVRTQADSGYADFELVCSDYENKKSPTEGEDRGYHCYSNFLTCLAGGTDAGTGESGIRTSCQEIFGSTLSDINKVNKNYGLGELRDNRRTLIKKQNQLDFEAGVPR